MEVPEHSKEILHINLGPIERVIAATWVCGWGWGWEREAFGDG